jgi:tRNA (cmo5U34)-methyltransferase
MGKFGESMWADEEFSNNYLENADIYIVERRKMIKMISSFFVHYSHGDRISLLDLGCGDGVLTEALLKINNNIHTTLVDGSQAMLQKAKERLGTKHNLSFVEANFQEILDNRVEFGQFDYCISAHAIHHLEMKDKERLFRFINKHLVTGGKFINADVVLPPSREIEEWYFVIWKQWMQKMMNKLNLRDEKPEDVIKKFKDPLSTNSPDTLEAQLETLKNAGFSDVDCYYKNGIFALFGGIKK